MKRLKESTLKRYSARQIAKHIYRMNPPNYWVDLAYNQILILDKTENGIGLWLFYFSICEQNKDHFSPRAYMENPTRPKKVS